MHWRLVAHGSGRYRDLRGAIADTSPLLAPGSSRFPSRLFVKLGFCVTGVMPGKGRTQRRDNSTRGVKIGEQCS